MSQANNNLILEFVDTDDNPICNVDAPSNPFTVGMIVNLDITNHNPNVDVKNLTKDFIVTKIEGTIRKTYNWGGGNDTIIISITVEEAPLA